MRFSFSAESQKDDCRIKKLAESKDKKGQARDNEQGKRWATFFNGNPANDQNDDRDGKVEKVDDDQGPSIDLPFKRWPGLPDEGELKDQGDTKREESIKIGKKDVVKNGFLGQRPRPFVEKGKPGGGREVEKDDH